MACTAEHPRPPIEPPSAGADRSGHGEASASPEPTVDAPTDPVGSGAEPSPTAAESAAEPRPDGAESPRISIPARRVTIGDAENPQASPTFELAIEAFDLDRDPVTVARFASFVAATGYRTIAEQDGGAWVFDHEAREVVYREGGMWSHPSGADGRPAGNRHPVTQVALADAVAFCAWSGGRLPTEFEWELAARNAGSGPSSRYPWGDHLIVDGHFMANLWQGIFPVRNTLQDGYFGTSPVGVFGPTPLGLHDMAGNVWQWTSSPFTAYPPTLPPDVADADEYTIRGGSFLCDPVECDGAVSTARRGTPPRTARADLGFRCVYTVAGEAARP